MRAVVVLLVAASVGIIACTGPRHARLTPQEEAFLERLDSVQTTFRLPADVADIAWERAHYFIEEHSWVPIEVDTETLIRTGAPRLQIRQCGYSITRQVEGEEVEFSVECIAGEQHHIAAADRNARMMAHYMMTGELPVDPEKLISH